MDRPPADARVEVEMRNMHGDAMPQSAPYSDDDSPAGTHPGMEGMTVFNMPTLEPFEVDEDCQVSEMGGMTIFNMPRLVLDMDSVMNHRYSEGLAGEAKQKGTYGKLSSPKVTDSNRTSTNSEEPGGPMGAKEQRGPSRCMRMFGSVHQGLEKLLESIGLAVTRKPLLTICIALLVSAILCLGTLRRSYETRVEELWTPSDSNAIAQQRYVTDLYGQKPRYTQFVIRPNPKYGAPNRDLLHPLGLDKLLQLHQGAVAIQFHKDGLQSYPSVCEGIMGGPVTTNQIGDCAHASILSIFGYDPSRWQDAGSIIRTINDPSLWSQFTPPGFVVTQYLGGIQRDANGLIVRANALMAEYPLHQNADELGVDPAHKTHAMLWEDQFLEYIKRTSEEDHNIEKLFVTVRATERSMAAEVRDGVDTDSFWVALAVIVFVCLLCNMLWIFDNGIVGSRIGLTLFALITYAMAMGATFGVYCLCGFKISPSTNTLPLMIGVLALNSVFVLVGAFDATSNLDAEDRARSTMRTGWVSVTVSALALALGFLVGVASPLEGLRAVSFFCACGVLFHWALQITFFMTILSFDGERITNNKLDILCCLTRRHKSGFCVKEWSPPDEPYVVLFTRFLCSVLQTRLFKLLVLVCSGGLLALGILGCIQMRSSANPKDFLPKSSYLNELYKYSTDDGYRTSLGTQMAVYLKSANGDPLSLRDPNLDTYIGAIGSNLAANEYILPGSVINWVNDFSRYSFTNPIEGTPASLDTLYTYLKNFLTSFMGVYFRSDLVFADTDPTKGVVSTRIRAVFRNSANDPRHLAKALDSVNRMLRSLPPQAGIVATAFAYNEPLVEQYQHVGRNAMIFMGAAIAVITVACVVLLANVGGALLVGASVLSVMLQLAGCLHFLGFKLDYIAFVLIFVSLGVLADYMIHIVYALRANYKAGVQDVVYTAMEECGSSILRGALVILVSAIFLAPTISHVFSLLFCTWMLIALLGFFQALAVIPAIFQIMLPSSRS